VKVELEFNHALSADCCRRLMLGSEPWVTLGFTAADVERLAAARAEDVIGARVGDEVVGFSLSAAGVLIGGYLRLLVVAPEYRGRGIGSQLLAAFEKQTFARWPNAYLCVSDFNERARQFYRRAGYHEVGELKDLLVPGRIEILMRKSIGDWQQFRTQSSSIQQ
jgi:ribosomal protein S18 acetylase RimI-like enzyme